MSQIVNNNQPSTINLPYDVNQAINQDLWDGAFQSISLYSLMEYLLLDINNIKVSLKMNYQIYTQQIC